MAGTIVTGDQYFAITGQLAEITRQIRQPNGYPFDPEMLKKHLQDAVEGKFSFNLKIIYKTIKLGTGLSTADDFRKALAGNGSRIDDWANEILGKPAFTSSIALQKTEVELIKVTVAELGFKNGATRLHVYNRAKQLGLYFCPAEIGPQLRLQYLDQPNGEWLLIAMEPIADSGGVPRVFIVERDESGFWLYGGNGHPDEFWNADFQCLFLRRKY